MRRNLKYSEVPSVKNQILAEQHSKCCICGKDLTPESAVLDHQHRNNKHEEIGLNNGGLVRGVLCRECNVLEGKIWNALKRYQGCTDVKSRLEWLSKLIQYYQKPVYDLVHPTEKLPEKKVSKLQYNRLKKLYANSGKKRKFPDYPKSGSLTKDLKTLFEMFDLSPYK